MDKHIWLDLSDLSGDRTPTSLADFVADNSEYPPDEDELSRLRALRVGQSAHLSIGGGSVRVKRVR